MRSAVFSKANLPNLYADNKEDHGGNHKGDFCTFLFHELLKILDNIMAVAI